MKEYSNNRESYGERRIPPYPKADSRRSDDCGVLPGRDHLSRCQSYEARRIRRRQARDRD